MKDFAGSRTTYYSLAREKLRGKHPRMLNVLILLLLISMAGFSAFLLSDILSFGLNSDHRTFLASLEGQDSIDNILSIMNWNEKTIDPAAVENSVAQRRRFDNPLESNTSPGSGAIVRVVANKSGDENSSPSRTVYIGQNAKEQNNSNSSRTASNQQLNGSTFVSTGYTSSSKLVNEKKAPVVKMNHGSSSGTPVSRPLKQEIQANATNANTTQVNTAQVNTTQLNTTKMDAAQVSNIQTNDTSINQLQITEVSATRSPIDGLSTGQSQADQASAKDSLIGQSQSQSQSNVAEIDYSQTNSSLNTTSPGEGRASEDTVTGQSANAEIKNISGLREIENQNTAPGNSPANPVTTLTALAQNSAVNADLPKDAADSPAGPAKGVSAEIPSLVIEFKTDSTTSPGSENSPSDGNTNSGTSSNANAPSKEVTPESSPAAENKDSQHDVSPSSTDSTSNTKSPAIEGGSASLKKPDTTVASKTKKLQEIKHQKTANQNRVVENAKKRATRSRG
jgi:hypothetical protein